MSSRTARHNSALTTVLSRRISHCTTSFLYSQLTLEASDDASLTPACSGFTIYKRWGKRRVKRWEKLDANESLSVRCKKLPEYTKIYFKIIAKVTHPFNGLLSATTRVSQYQKGKTNLDFTEARDSEWQWHQLGRMQVCTLLQTDNHASTPPLSFYRLDALPATLPKASMH